MTNQALQEITEASPSIIKYYQTLLEHEKTPPEVKEELISLAHLLIGTCHVDEQKVAFLCADRACRVFAPKALREVGLVEEAEKLESLEEITSVETAEFARSVAWSASRSVAADWSAAWPAWSAARSTAAAAWSAAAAAAAWSAEPAARSAAAAAARSASRSVAGSDAWVEAVRLFKDLCSL